MTLSKMFNSSLGFSSFLLIINLYIDLKACGILVEGPLDSKEVISTAAAAAKSPQLCPTLCNPIDGSPPASPVPGILQTRTLE